MASELGLEGEKKKREKEGATVGQGTVCVHEQRSEWGWSERPPSPAALLSCREKARLREGWPQGLGGKCESAQSGEDWLQSRRKAQLWA